MTMSMTIFPLMCVLLFAVVSVTATSEFPSVVGIFSGMADWYEFKTTPNDIKSHPLGSDIINYKQDTRLVFTEQQGPFFRGTEYYADETQLEGWAFVANLYGIMTEMAELDGKPVYSMRIDEWLNESSADLESSDVTVGSFTGILNNDTLSVEYTGGTKSRNKFGAQHIVMKKQEG